jgi:serine/threonine protein kinase
MERLSPGALFAERYEIIRCIGVGGMGAVYEVRHVGTRRRAALTVLLPGLLSDGDARQRFAVEACITASVDSEHLVEVFDAGVDRATGAPFIVMELLKGTSLGHRVQGGKRLPAPEVLEILTQVARALEKTHAAGVVHRDLKPDNLFLAERPDKSLFVKVLDFGIAKAIAAGASRNTTNFGTPIYMAPEQLDGSALDGRADVFSLGHIAFELLTGEHYWEPELRAAPSSMAMLRIIDRGHPERASIRAGRLGVDVGVSFDAWFDKATARSASARHQTPTELVEGFADALGLLQYAPTLVMQLPSDLATALQAAPEPVVSGHAPAPRGPTAWNLVSTRPAQGRSRVLLGVAAATVLISGAGLAAWSLAHQHAGTVASAGPLQPPSSLPGASPTGEPMPAPSATERADAIPSSSAPPETSASASASSPKVGPKPVPRTKGCAKDPRRCR